MSLHWRSGGRGCGRDGSGCPRGVARTVGDGCRSGDVVHSGAEHCLQRREVDTTEPSGGVPAGTALEPGLAANCVRSGPAGAAAIMSVSDVVEIATGSGIQGWVQPPDRG